MAPQRFGEKVTYQNVRKLSENCNLFSSGREQEFSVQQKNSILTKTADAYMDIYRHEFIKAQGGVRTLQTLRSHYRHKRVQIKSIIHEQ